MTRRPPSRRFVASLVALLHLSQGAFAQQALRGAAPAPIVNASPAAPGGVLVSPVATPQAALPLIGDVSVTALPTPALAVPEALGLPAPTAGGLAAGIAGAAAPAVRLAGPRSAIDGIAAPAASPLALAAEPKTDGTAETVPGSTLANVQRLAEEGSSKDGTPGAPETASAAAFDGNNRDGAGPSGPVDGGSGGGQGGNPGGSDNNGGDGLGKLYPRVVMILDTLKAPVDKGHKLVGHIESLLDQGVRVIFVTARPEKGENSAESVLTKHLKFRTGNPPIIVSYNGARIAAHTRAEKPKGLVEDLPGFAAATVEKFREINLRVAKSLGVGDGVSEFGIPSTEEPYLYGGVLPASVDAAAWTRTYNRALKAAGFRYKVETAKAEDGKVYFFTQSTALRLNTGRIFNGLYALAPELNPANGETGALKNSEVLVLADPATAPSFLQSLPGKGYSMHGVKDAAGLADALSAVLGKTALEKVSVNRYDLRDYVEWQERQKKFGSGFSRAWKGNPANRELGFYRGILIKELMARLYHTIRKGQYHLADVDTAVEMLHSMWYNPKANGIRVPPEVEQAMTSKAWKALGKGYLETSKRWLRNYYHRNFRDYPRGISQEVVARMIRLGRDGDTITVNFASPYTGRNYVIYVRPDRTELHEGTDGYTLVGHVYRTGREPTETAFEDSIDKALVARALLDGDAQKRADGRWYVNDEPDPKVKVVFHYNTREISDTMTTAEVEALTPEITALIEKRETDQAYQKWRAEQDKKREAALKASERAAKRRLAQRRAARVARRSGK